MCNFQFKSTPTAEEAHVHFSADFIFVFYMVQDELCIISALHGL